MSARIALLAGIVNVFISLFAWHETASLAFKILGIISFIAAYILNRIEEKKKLKEQSKDDLRNITEEFLNQQHVFIFSQFDSDITKLMQKCRLQNHFNDTYAMNQVIALIANYSNDFLTQIENRTTKINGSKSFLDQKIKKHLEKYLESDVEFLNQKLAATFPMRIKSTPMTNATNEGEAVLRKIYTGFLLKLFDL